MVVVPWCLALVGKITSRQGCRMVPESGKPRGASKKHAYTEYLFSLHGCMSLPGIRGPSICGCLSTFFHCTVS